jgi:predicted DNA-binding WGR domain protein
MATKKKAAGASASGNATFAPPGTQRTFVHPDGRTYALEVVDCRVLESWTVPGKKGGSSRSTRESDADAHGFALAKVRELEKKGYVEGPSGPGVVIDRACDIVETHARVERRKANAWAPVGGRPNTYVSRNVSVEAWLVTNEPRTLGVVVRCALFSVMPPKAPPEDERAAMADAILDVLHARRDEILSGYDIPLRKLRLERPIGRFDHLVVLSPVVHDEILVDESNKGDPVLSRSLFLAFPAFDCEVMGTEHVALAEARTDGPHSIPSSSWSRDPHPVFDVAHPKGASETPRFKVCNPAKPGEWLDARALGKLTTPSVLVRNFRGEVREYARGSEPPAPSELRAWLLGA